MTATRKVKKEIKKNKKSKKKLDGTVKKGSKRKNVVVKKEAKVVKKKEKVKRKLYSTVDLQRAVNAVNHGTSVRKAALKYSVPPTSIHRAVKNPEQSNLKAGPAPILSTEVENEIVSYWLEVKKAIGDAGKKSRSLIKSVENNHKLIVVPQTVPASTSFELMNESNLNVTNDLILIELDGIEDNELNALLNNESLESIIIETNSTIEHIVEHEHALPENLDTVISQKETIHESADMTNEPNDFQAISTVLIDQIEEPTSPTITNKDNCQTPVTTNFDLSLEVTDEVKDNSEEVVDVQFTKSVSPQNQDISPVLQENVQNICKEINHKSSNLLQENQENIGLASVDSDSTAIKKKSFANSFLLPVDHLSKKKRAKLNATGKPKLPAVGTLEEWWEVHLEKEEAKKTKEEQKAKKKLLQEEKKKLAEEKKRLAEEKKDYMR